MENIEIDRNCYSLLTRISNKLLFRFSRDTFLYNGHFEPDPSHPLLSEG